MELKSVTTPSIIDYECRWEITSMVTCTIDTCVVRLSPLHVSKELQTSRDHFSVKRRPCKSGGNQVRIGELVVTYFVAILHCDVARRVYT